MTGRQTRELPRQTMSTEADSDQTDSDPTDATTDTAQAQEADPDPDPDRQGTGLDNVNTIERPTERPTLDISELTADAISDYSDDEQRLLDTFRTLPLSHQAFFAATVWNDVAADGEPKRLSALADWTWYEPASLYGPVRGELRKQNLIAVDSSSVTVTNVTDDGLELHDILLRDFDINVLELTKPYYPPAAPSAPDDTDVDADAETEDEADEAPVSAVDTDPLYECSICDFGSDLYTDVVKHINSETDGGHYGTSGYAIDAVIDHTDTEDSSPPATGIDSLDDALLAQEDATATRDPQDDPDNAAGWVSGGEASVSSVGGPSTLRDDWDEDDAPSSRETDDAPEDTLDALQGRLMDAIGDMADREEQEAMSNLTRERVRAEQLKAQSEAIIAYCQLVETNHWLDRQRSHAGSAAFMTDDDIGLDLDLDPDQE